MKDYKEIWQKYYDKYIKKGLSESEASIRANISLGIYKPGDCCADLTDGDAAPEINYLRDYYNSKKRY